MARMVVVYKTPADPVAFDRHYHEVHIPLAKKLAGLRRYEISSGPIVMLGGAKDAYLVGTLHFDSLEAIKTAFASPEGQACAVDRRLLASDDNVQIVLFDSRDV